MEDRLRLHEAEYRFACLVWESEPIGSGRLAQRAQEALGWKRSTSYTVLKKLCQRGVLVNEDAQVRALVSREAVLQAEALALLDKGFEGSLAQLVALCLGARPLSKKECKQLKRLLDQAQEQAGKKGS